MLDFMDHGGGHPTVLLHGIPGSARTWSRVVPLLAGRVVVPDLLGFGRSPAAGATGHAFEQAAAVFDMLDYLGIGAAHVAGFDFGGPVAVAMHALAPGRLSRLTLLATNLLTDTPVPLPLQLARVPLAGELAFRLLFSRLGLKMLWRQGTADRAAFPLQDFLATLDDGGTATARRIFLQSLRQMARLYGPIAEELPRIDVPVTVLWGDRDPFFPVSAGVRTASRFRAANFVLVEGCGHFLPHERPEKVAAAISGGELAAATTRPVSSDGLGEAQALAQSVSKARFRNGPGESRASESAEGLR